MHLQICIRKLGAGLIIFYHHGLQMVQGPDFSLQMRKGQTLNNSDLSVVIYM